MPDLSPFPDPTVDLVALRAVIDGIDDAMHDLLMHRAAISASLAAGRVKGDAVPFRPGREAIILRRLLARHTGPLPRAVLLRIWREIIASSLAQQGPFSVAVLPAEPGGPVPIEMLARAHFGLDTPQRTHPTPARALAAVSAGEATVAVLPAPADGAAPGEAWWPGLEAPRLRVVAALPFLLPAAAGQGTPRPQALVVAAVPPDPTGRDRSLLRLEQAPGASRDALLAALEVAGLPPLRLTLHRDPSTPSALAEVAGFVAPGDPRLAALAPFGAVPLGAFAEPETLPT